MSHYSYSYIIILLCVFLVLLSSLDSAIAVNPTADGTEIDHHALLDFKNHIVGDPFHIMSSWNDSIHHCNWTGITCNISNNGRVIKLNLFSQRLVGTLTPFIGNLTFLTTLDLGDSFFHGEFPQEVGHLLHLQRLFIDDNNFGGSIPSNLSHCTKLTELSAKKNNFTGTIPTWIGNLTSLILISFVLNNLHGNIPHEVGRLSNLTYLQFPGNYLSGTIPSSIYNISSLSIFTFADNFLHGNIPVDVGFTLPNLQVFLGGANNFTGTIPTSLINASKLEILDFGSNSLTGTLPKEIGMLNRLTSLNFESNRLGSGRADDISFLDSLVNCTNLKFLGLEQNNLGGELPTSVANLSTQLQTFTIGSNRIQGNIPVGMGNLANISILALENNQLNGSVPDSLGRLQNLQELYIGGNNLSGKIPSSIGNLSLLTKLYMEENRFEGSIPSNLGNCQKLLVLNLSSNKLSGSIPKEVMSISSLAEFLDVSHNALSGSLPPEVGKLVTLGQLDLSENNFSGIIPSSLESCTSLERLYLQGNYFEGSIPQTLHHLRGLQDLDLSRNKFSGKIPAFLGALNGLQHLNLSYNDFEGEIPRDGIFKNATSISIYGNNKLCGGIPELNLLACTIRRASSSKKFLAPKVVISVVSAFVILFISCFSVIFMVIKRARKRTARFEDLEGEISYSIIAKCTNEFSQENLIGSGSFGSVYKGTLSSIGQTIAIKVLNLEQRGASRSFIDECRVLRNIRHRNLLKIITVISSIDRQANEFKALVFEFMSNGSLEDWLHPVNNTRCQTMALTFIQRLNIAIDVACALEYLHHFCQTPIVHCDIKPSNILLDSEMVAHVGDFGLATFLFQESSDFSMQSSMSAILKGSVGYIPPEYGMGGHPSTLGDIYSYGILLLEIFTRKKPTDDIFEGGMEIHKFTEVALPNHVLDIIDPLLLAEQESNDRNDEIFIEETSIKRKEMMEPGILAVMEEWLASVLQIGVSCSSTSPRERLPMTVVVNKLHDIKNSYLRFNSLQ